MPARPENRIRFVDRRKYALSLDLIFITTVAIFSAAISGCQVTHERFVARTAALASIGSRPTVVVKQVEPNHGIGFVNRIAQTIPLPSERTQLLMRKYDLIERYHREPDSVIRWLEQLAQGRPTMEEIHGLAEVAELQANWSVETGDSARAIRLYSIALVHAYQFLFDQKLDINRNTYDPQFRSICDIYNRSLESIIREATSETNFRSGQRFTVGTDSQGIEFVVALEGRWENQTFDRFELAHDYQTSGLDNQYHTYGLGVPLIAVRSQQEFQSEFEKYYPPELTLPMTAFVHFEDGPSARKRTGRRQAVLRLYDPLETTTVKAGSTSVPLESDITTPLAYSLRDPLLSKGVLATASLLDADFAVESQGMFMLEPYDPNKIPVVMVHGLWSSPFTWLHMFNDLRANRDIQDNYQFWFYAYPTGQPFWVSAQQMRRDLAAIQRELDPRGDSKSLDQMVLVGHSMGGLVSLMQTVESNDHFWKIVSESSIDSFEGDQESLNKLKETFYFHPNRSIDRVITIATPFQGSEFANAAARWVSHKLFTLPALVTGEFETIARRNADKLDNTKFLTTATSIDSLAPENPIFQAINAVRPDNSVTMHNIVGRLDKVSFFKSKTSDSNHSGDGVVSLESAANESAKSEIFVASEHQEVHQNPAAIFEVRRILIEHLAEHDRVRVRELPQISEDRQLRMHDRSVRKASGELEPRAEFNR